MAAVCSARLAVTRQTAQIVQDARMAPAAWGRELVMVVIWSSRGVLLAESARTMELGAGRLLLHPQFVLERFGAALAQG